MRASRTAIVVFSGLIILGIVKLRAPQPALVVPVAAAQPQLAEVTSRSIGSSPWPAQKNVQLPQPSSFAVPASRELALSPDEDDDAMTVAAEAAPSSSPTDFASETMAAAMAAIVPELNRCYREALLRDSSLRGDITIEMTVAPGPEQGIIEDAVVDAEELQAPLFEQCLLSALLKLRLPKPTSRVYVSYPFTLDPGEEDEKSAAE